VGWFSFIVTGILVIRFPYWAVLNTGWKHCSELQSWQGEARHQGVPDGPIQRRLGSRIVGASRAQGQARV